MEMKKQSPETIAAATEEFAPVVEKINLIKRCGFGEVKVLIKNGVIYRILVTEDKMIHKDD